MRNTFSKFVLASAVVAAAAFTSLPAMAASEGAVNINVPFNFTVQGKILPAGTYKVRWDDTGNFVTIQSGTAVDSFLWKPAGAPTADRRVTMRFEELGQGHALQSIQYGAMTTPELTRDTRKNERTAPVHRSDGQ
jgi:hypothetical protein